MTNPVASGVTSKRRHLESVKGYLLDIINRSEEKRTPLSVTHELQSRYRVPKEAAKGALRELICEGELDYTNHFGTSYVEQSYLRPVHISKQIVLKPPQWSYSKRKNETVVDLIAGSAFGSGSHPTTRLAIRGIEFALHVLAAGKRNSGARALDIGTGSGVLAIVSVKLGVEKAVAVDIDPCARAEAKKNIALNHLDDRIVVKSSATEAGGQFILISANLRAPTINKLYPYLIKSTIVQGMIVVSGIRYDEAANLLKNYSTGPFSLVFTERELGWCCMVFQKQTV